MSSAEEASWRVRPDRGALTKGVGVLIDTEYLSSDSEARRMNPYFIVIDGNRYYGPTPEEVVQTAREHPDVKASIKGEAAFRPQAAAPQQTALPARNRPANAGRTMKNRAAGAWQSMKSGAAAAAASVGAAAAAAKNKFKSKPAASGAASGAAPAPAPAPASMQNSANRVEIAGNPRPGEGETDQMLPGTNGTAQRGGRRMTKKRGRRSRSRHRR